MVQEANIVLLLHVKGHENIFLVLITVSVIITLVFVNVILLLQAVMVMEGMLL
jgi:hypothetical protein